MPLQLHCNVVVIVVVVIVVLGAIVIPPSGLRNKGFPNNAQMPDFVAELMRLLFNALAPLMHH